MKETKACQNNQAPHHESSQLSGAHTSWNDTIDTISIILTATDREHNTRTFSDASSSPNAADNISR